MFMQNAIIILDIIFLHRRAYHPHYYNKQPYYTSVLTGEEWVQELLSSHPKCNYAMLVIIT